MAQCGMSKHGMLVPLQAWHILVVCRDLARLSLPLSLSENAQCV